jgi:hypothetical protein
VRTYLPDVLVVQFGLNECQPWLVPVSLIRHLLREHDAVTRTARRYRRHVARPLWKRVRWFRRRIAGTVGTRTWQTTPRRFAGHLDRLLSTATYEGRPLVLVLDLDDPRGTLAHFLPGMPERIETYREVIRSTVAKYADRDVRLVPVSELTRGRDDLLADGMHYTPEAHRIIGERLAAEVVDWLSARGG